jgi:imidazole glycerol-phosphate synthase subunit HisH
MLIIVNYGSGNIKAIANVYQKLGVPFRIAQNPAELADASRILLPGVGVFDETISQLQRSGFTSELNAHVSRGTPILGICVGMQIMAEGSEEGSLPGLGWIKGRVRRFDAAGGRPLPHMGWNDVTASRSTPLFSQLEQDARFYFLHSYFFECTEPSSVIAESDYGARFSCAVQTGNVHGVQFHPEKSHRFGVQLLKNFATL